MARDHYDHHVINVVDSSSDENHNIIHDHLVSTHGGSDLQDMSQISEDLIINIMQKHHLPPDQCGSNLKESETTSHNAHGDQPLERQGVGGHNIGDQQKEEEEEFKKGHNHVDIGPHKLPLHEGTKFEFILFGVDMMGALVNYAASSSAKEHQLLIYAVVVTTMICFMISTVSFILNKKKPEMAQKMQKLTFLFGAFGFMGILGMLFPANLMWWFTISAFLVFLFVFTVATKYS